MRDALTRCTTPAARIGRRPRALAAGAALAAIAGAAFVLASASVGASAAAPAARQVAPASRTPATPARPHTAATDADLQRMHRDFVRAFIDSEGFGMRRVTPMMRVMQQYRTSGDPALWVEQLSLVGIARHRTPVVFDAAFMGFQHGDGKAADHAAPARPRAARGRAMTAEERAAVQALSRGQRLVVREDAPGLRVIGPIRATAPCLACHTRERAGDLLGAFVYTLRPLPPPSR